MGKTINQNENTHRDDLLAETTYKGNQSSEFDKLVRNKERTYARMKNQSEATKDKLVISEWHVPCHCILTQTEDGTTQAFHVQPDQLGPTLLSFEQERTLKEIGKIPKSKAVVSFSQRSHYGNADRRELTQFGFTDVKEIPVETNQWWRILYNPETNEIWIDDKIHHRLLKYRGFPRKENDVETSKLPIETDKVRKLLS